MSKFKMNRLLSVTTIGFILISHICGIQISFVTWNVNDNKKFSVYTEEIITKLLNLADIKNLPDLYAISFQENCVSCGESHLNRLALPFIDTLQSKTGTKYDFLSISATRESNLCESMYCLPTGSLHGTTFIMILIQTKLQATNVFKLTINSGSDALFSNKEKGITVVGLEVNKNKLCFGGLHLDVGNVKYRQLAFDKILKELRGKCEVTFFGGDFNTRPNAKSHSIPVYFNGGKNETYLAEIKKTDELSGSTPFSGGVNLLDYLAQKEGKRFIEPFNEAPKFQPTYSIKSALQCKDFPVCYVPDRFPSWTDRVIFSPESKVKCKEYSIIPSLGFLSDHLPVFANCDIL